MTGNQLRSSYLDFFAGHDSLVVPSSSLVPTDPTTLLTSAGMQPLVPYFKGEETPPNSRLTSCQKCCRTDDFDQVGVTWRHASFFEMLGNFSFGDYFKREAIVFAWEYLTKTLNIDPQLLWVSVYHEDDEAPQIWKRDIGLSDERILRLGKKDNWWGPVGRSGPCGPDSEIFYDRGAKYDSGDLEMDRPGGDGDRYGELWNLVFQQFNQQENGELLPLPAPGIDTGMGLERTAAVLQGVDTIHHTDLFAPIINAISNLRHGNIGEFSASAPELNPQNSSTRPLKIVADHIRAATFLGSDGIAPGNTGRDYMMRRLIRRASLTARSLDLGEPFLHKLVPVVAQVYGDVYPELATRGEAVSAMIQREEERFGATLEGGMSRLEDLIESQKAKNTKVLDGAEVFRLYETYGFPRELTAEVAAQSSLSIDEESFRAAQEAHSKKSGSAVGEYKSRAFGNLETEFVGYTQTDCDAEIIAMREVEGEKVRPDSGVLFAVVLNRTPFYAESGGQIGDTGELVGEGFRARVLDTKKEGKTWIHSVEILEGEPRENLQVRAAVDAARRRAIERAHSATHLLHAALRKHLGTHVEQRGSLVSPDKLRFDFVHFGAINDDDLAQIEDTVNAEILESLPIEIREMSLDEAKRSGAMALFGEKYGNVVQTVRMGEFSLELCGGTHLPVTSAAGFCRILSEGGVGSNLRRLEALTGTLALQHDRTQNERLLQTARELNAQPENAVAAAEKLRARVRDLEKQAKAAQLKMAGAGADDLAQKVTAINGTQLVVARAPQGLDAKALGELAEQVLAKMDGVVVLATDTDGKVLWAGRAAKSATERGAHAGNLVRELAQITGGNGGGKANAAQAGGKDVNLIEAALAKTPDLLAAQIG